MIWPIQGKKKTSLPDYNEPGSFGEHRGDRLHCGVDIYAEKGERVVSIEEGVIVLVDLFTSKEMIPYWNATYQVILKARSGLFYRFAELQDTLVVEGDSVVEGQVIGHVGEVLDKAVIDETSPLYIQRLKNMDSCSMLHLEIYKTKPLDSKQYLGGNWFDKNLPKNLLNPNEILDKITDASEKQKP